MDECKLQKKSHLTSFYETLKSTRPKYGHMVHTRASDMVVGDEYTDCMCAIDFFLCKRANVRISTEICECVTVCLCVPVCVHHISCYSIYNVNPAHFSANTRLLHVLYCSLLFPLTLNWKNEN